MSIYSLMKKDWKIYCLMCAVLYIEEVQKPTDHPQIKKYKNSIYHCDCFHSTRLKMKNLEVVSELFNTTKLWEDKLKIILKGEKLKEPKKENFSGQYLFYFSPIWLNKIIKECGKIPNEYSLNTAIKRINHLKQYKKEEINLNKNLFKELLIDKKLAAGAFIISMDLEFRGMQSGRPSLCMSEKFKDFLEFMLRVAQKWNWTNNKQLSPVSVEYNKKLGINASPQFEFRINIEGLKEIYSLAGPLIDSSKDKCIKFNIERSKNYINKGYKLNKNNTKNKILEFVCKNKDSTTTNLQFIANVGVDVVLRHLYDLERKGKIIKQRKGKRYIWNIK